MSQLWTNTRLLLLVGLAAAAMAGCVRGVLGRLPTPATRLNRADPKFGQEMDRILSDVGPAPVDVVIAGEPPANADSITGITDTAMSGPVNERLTYYSQVIITRLDREELEIRPSVTSSSKVVIPNFQIQQIKCLKARPDAQSTLWYLIPYVPMIAFLLIGAIVILSSVLSGSYSGGSGAPPVGCMTLLGILSLVGGIAAFMALMTRLSVDQEIVVELVDKVWVFL